MLKVLIEEVFYRRSVPRAASYGSITLVLQKLGIPTEISHNYLSLHENPIDDMADAEGLGSSIHIMPGVNKELYGAAPWHRVFFQAGCRIFDCLQLTRGKGNCTTTVKSSPQASAATVHSCEQACLHCH
jgi:hypothetical protein